MPYPSVFSDGELLNATRLNQWTTAIKTGGGAGSAPATGGAATLAEPSGTITSEALTTAAASAYTLTITNTTATASSMVFASVCNGTNTQGQLVIETVTPGSSSIVIVVRNRHASEALNGTIKISFLVLNPA